MEMDHSQHMNHHDGHMNMAKSMNRKFWLAIILTIPIMIFSPMQGMSFFDLPNRISWLGALISLILGSIVYFYCGEPFFSGAKQEFKAKKPEMMALITLGITVAYFYSVYAVITNNIFHVNPAINNFFGELATLVDIMLLGHLLEMRSINATGSAVDAIKKLLPEKANLVTSDGNIQSIDINKIENKNILQVKAGEKIPADGLVTKGTTTVNEALITGESAAVTKSNGDKVIGGSINNSGTIQFEVTNSGNDSYLNQVIKLVTNAQNSKSNTQSLANKIAGYLFYVALTIAVIAFVIWIYLKGLNVALPIAVTTLIIACPHALGLAIPLIITRATGIAANHGLLFKNANALEETTKVKYVLMDKTGTLTQGNFVLNHYQSLNENYSDQQILAIIAGLEQQSSHSLAKGVLEKAHAEDIKIPITDDINEISGVGISGVISQQKYELVSASYLENQKISYDIELFNEIANQGNSVSFLVLDQEVIGIMGEGDQIKVSAKSLIDYLKQNDFTPVMLTGDNAVTAKTVANELGIADYQTNLLPSDKERNVMEYQKQGEVMFVGDGVNDAPSLNRANVGVAIGSGTDVAIESADVILVNSDPQNIIDLIKLSKRTKRKMVENLWWGAGYNIVALPLAAGILAPIGIILSPMAGAILMSLSTIIVAINAMTLKIK